MAQDTVWCRQPDVLRIGGMRRPSEGGLRVSRPVNTATRALGTSPTERPAAETSGPSGKTDPTVQTEGRLREATKPTALAHKPQQNARCVMRPAWIETRPCCGWICGSSGSRVREYPVALADFFQGDWPHAGWRAPAAGSRTAAARDGPSQLGAGLSSDQAWSAGYGRRLPYDPSHPTCWNQSGAAANLYPRQKLDRRVFFED